MNTEEGARDLSKPAVFTQQSYKKMSEGGKEGCTMVDIGKRGLRN